MHGVKIYSACLNENSSNTGLEPLVTNNSISHDSSTSTFELALFEAALKDLIASNRSISSLPTFASNQLIAAANAARTAQQQQSPSLSSRAAGASVGALTGANGKTNIPLSNLASSIPASAYPSLLQEAAHRSSSFVKLLAEAAKQQACQTCGNDNTNNDTISFTDNQFLTPKAVDVSITRVSAT